MGNSTSGMDSTDGQTSSQSSSEQNQDDVANLQLPSEFSSKYQVISSIGKGGFGNVYKVRDLKTKAVYAVKVLKLNDSNQKEVGLTQYFMCTCVLYV